MKKACQSGFELPQNLFNESSNLFWVFEITLPSTETYDIAPLLRKSSLLPLKHIKFLCCALVVKHKNYWADMMYMICEECTCF